MTEAEFPYQSERFKEVWAEWMQYRKERRLPIYKPTGLRRTMTALVRDSHGDEWAAINLIINAMEKSWQGIHAYNVKPHAEQPGNQPTAGTSASRLRGLKEW